MKIDFKGTIWHFLTNRNSSMDLKKKSFEYVDSCPKILLFRTHQLTLLKVPYSLYIWQSPIIFSVLFTSENSFWTTSCFFRSKKKPFLLPVWILLSKHDQKKYRRWSDVQAIIVRKFFNLAPSSERCAKSLSWEISPKMNLENVLQIVYVGNQFRLGK